MTTDNRTNEPTEALIADAKRRARKRRGAGWLEEADMLDRLIAALEAATRVPVQGEPNEDRPFNAKGVIVAAINQVDAKHDLGSGDLASSEEYADAILAAIPRATVPDAATELAQLRAERDAGKQAEADRAYLYQLGLKLGAERDAALAAIERAKSEHKSTGYWIGSDPGEVHEREPDGNLCLTCSDDDTGERLDNWEFDMSLAGWVSWPCPTIQALDGAPEPEVLPVEGEPSGDPHEMSEHSVVAYHEWRNILGRDHLSDDEGTAARIAFYAGWDHARAVTPEPDWEYGLRTRSKHDPARGFFSYAGDLETAWEMYGATYEHCTATIVRRRKAGPWLPVEGEGKL